VNFGTQISVPLRDAEWEGFDLQLVERMQQMEPTLRCKNQSCRSAAGNRADLASAQASAASCSQAHVAIH